MGLSFRKSFKLGKHARVTISKVGVSISAGIKGMSVNFSKRGVRTTVSKNGFRYTKKLK